MKKAVIFTLLFLIGGTGAFAQVGINNDNSAPDPSAMLDVKSVVKGFLPPRVTQLQMSQIVNPADGLMVYCTTDSKVYVFMASLGQWREISLGAGAVNPPFTCGKNLTISHTIDSVAPVAKTVTYGTVSGIPGEAAKCWITRNLGASQQATSVSDTSEASAGWLWQFNRKQGYRASGYTITPFWSNFFIDENADWQIASDPCRLELGTLWRIPTLTEWSNVTNAGGWTNWNGPWNSLLKLHGAGFIYGGPNGYLVERGSAGYYWSSTQDQSFSGWLLGFNSEGIEMSTVAKAGGASVRCIRDTCSVFSSVGVSIVPSSNPFCDGNEVIFTAMPVNGGTSPVYQWKVNGINVESDTSAISYFPANNDAVNCSMTSNQQCVENNTANSNVVVMTANPSVTVGLTIAPSANPACQGSQVTFTATPANGGTTPAYQWRKGGVNISGATNQTYQYIPANGDVITCLLTSSLVCTYVNPMISNVITMTVNPVMPVGIAIVASANTVCAGSSVTFTSTPTNGGTIPGYQWKKGGVAISGATGSTYTYVPVNGDVITCTMTSNIMCTSGNPATSNAITMTVNPMLPVSVAITASANNICNGSSVTYTAIPTNGGTTPVYQWKKGGTNISGATNSTYTFAPANGNVITCVMTSNATCPTGNPATSNVITMTVISSFTINHVAGEVAPVTKTVTYGTTIGLPGEPAKCWITSNLGADHQATSVDDATEASAGWYWQFNRKQGYKHDGALRTPAPWNPTNDNLSATWEFSKDPCTLELGAIWRVPTFTEWYNVDISGGWLIWTGPWSSNLKLHAAGCLDSGNGSLVYRGSYGFQRSGTQYSAATSWYLIFSNGSCGMDKFFDKSFGYSVRCIRE